MPALLIIISRGPSAATAPSTARSSSAARLTSARKVAALAPFFVTSSAVSRAAASSRSTTATEAPRVPSMTAVPLRIPFIPGTPPPPASPRRASRESACDRGAVGDAHALQKSCAIGIVVGARGGDRIPDTIHRRLAPLVAVAREIAVDVVELRRPLPRLDAATARDPHGWMRLLQRLGPDVHVAELRVLAVERKDVEPRPGLHDEIAAS